MLATCMIMPSYLVLGLVVLVVLVSVFLFAIICEIYDDYRARHRK